MANLQELGAMWKKTSQRTGATYYTGDIDVPGGGTIKIIAFDNDRKEKETQPDIRIYLDEKEPQGSGGGRSESGRGGSYQRPAAPNRAPAPATPPAAPAAIQYPEEDINPDDIPF